MAKTSTNVKINNETRSNIIKLLESGTHTRKTISKTFDIFQSYLTENKNTKKDTGGNRPRKLNPNQVTWLQQEFDNVCSQFLKVLQGRIRDAFQISISTTSIAAYIDKFNYTLNRVHSITKKAVSPTMIEPRKTYVINFLRLLNGERNIYYTSMKQDLIFQ